MKKTNMPKPRTLVIGIDGATFDLINPWIEKGELPNMQKLLKNGVHAKLISTQPEYSAPAWTSMVTGKNPGKHNIFDFLNLESHNRIVINSGFRKSEAIWNVLNRHEESVVVINVPATYPPEKVNGVLISGMLTPNEESDFVHPKQLKKEILEMGYKIDISNLFHVLLFIDKNKLLQELNNITRKRGKIALWIMKKFQPDFVMIVFTNADRIQHFFWKHLKGENVNRSKAILEHYQLIDNLIGEFIKNSSKETTVIIVSDHGFGPLLKGFYINNYLMELGLLNLKSDQKPSYLKKLGFTWENTLKLFARLPQALQRAIIKNALLLQQLYALWNRILPTRSVAFLEIDLSKTKAYCPIGMYLKINLKRRQQNPVAKPSKEYDELKKYLIEKLYDVRDPENGKRVIERVYEKEEIFWGPYLSKAPDLLVRVKEGYAIVESIGNRKLFGPFKEWLSERSGEHRRDGIFIIMGPNVKKGKKLGEIHIWDVMPTILYTMGVPIPTDVDGKALTEAFIKSYIKTSPPTYEETPTEKTSKEKPELSEEETEKVLKRLKALGYI